MTNHQTLKRTLTIGALVIGLAALPAFIMGARDRVAMASEAHGRAVAAAETEVTAPAAPDPDAETCVLIAGNADEDPNGIEGRVSLHMSVTGRADALDYQGGAWVDERGDGRVIGYSLEEDSDVWTTAECAAAHPAY